tara:strand:- start:865 stop:1371 length:507 start_codon:yes stop_codon:yes gene_type:complete
MIERIGIMFGSTTANSERTAETIWDIMKETELHDIKDGVEVLEQYNKVILVAPTWDYGGLQEDYIEAWDKLKTVNWKNKSVALVGLGDQVGYGDLYQDSMSTLYETIKELGGTFVGFTTTEGHKFEKSKATRGDKFVGLAIDEDNQSKLTQERLNTWIEKLRETWSLN